MNKQPVKYFQTDSRWRNIDYSAAGEKTTIGGSGCGPTCAAMLIETITGKTFTPVDACAWSLSHGYKAPNQGTYYSYFTPQFAAHGIDCKQLNWTNITKSGGKDNPVHDQAFDLLKQGYYLIACMGKGLWTSSGHYIVVWWEDGKVRINDSASTKENRENGDLDTFKSQVKYYWAVDAREHNAEEDDEDMDVERFSELMTEYRKTLQDNDHVAWTGSDDDIQWCVDHGIYKGSGQTIDGEPNLMLEDFITRQQLASVIRRLAQLLGV